MPVLSLSAPFLRSSSLHNFRYGIITAGVLGGTTHSGAELLSFVAGEAMAGCDKYERIQGQNLASTFHVFDCFLSCSIMARL